MNSAVIEPMRLPADIASRMRIPVIAAPMMAVSGPDLVVESCKAGIIGSFPTQNPKHFQVPGGLDAWLGEMNSRLADISGDHAPIAPNIVMRADDLGAQIDAMERHGIKMVITSVGSPKPIMARLKEAGIFVFADVATIEHARKAIDVGVDGLILLTAGAGGQTGWLNPFTYVRAVRPMFDGAIVMAGGIIDGVSLRAARALGCDLAYMGTKLIATTESLAADSYKEAVVASTMDDVVATKAFNGLMGSYLKSAIIANGLDPNNLDESISELAARDKYGSRGDGPRRWVGLISAGHTVSGVKAIQSVAEVVEQTAREYESAGV